MGLFLILVIFISRISICSFLFVCFILFLNPFVLFKGNNFHFSVEILSLLSH